jgi:hypothetical protein
MAISDSRRLYIVVPHLYPDLKSDTGGSFNEGDYRLENRSDGNGTQLIWHNGEITAPTNQELADAKEAAVDAYWWKLLRKKRDKLLVDSDWSQGIDVPSALKNSYATYRTNLRDLPTTVTKPSFSTLNNQASTTWIEDINALMPVKP